MTTPTPISQVVARINTWDPGKDAPSARIRYIDISSVDRDVKAISGVAEMRGRDAPSRARQLVQAGDVLVSTVRPNLNAVALVPRELDGATASTGFTVLSAVVKHLPRGNAGRFWALSGVRRAGQAGRGCKRGERGMA
jgi:hypothetical protein